MSEYPTDPLDVLFELYVASAISERWNCDAYQGVPKFAKVDLICIRGVLPVALVACKRRVASFEKYEDQRLNQYGIDQLLDMARKMNAAGLDVTPLIAVGEIIEDRAVFRYAEAEPTDWPPPGVTYRKDRPHVKPKPAYHIPNRCFRAF